MSIVVSDTSPIRALANLGLLGLLERMFGDVIIPEAVALELSQPPAAQSDVDLVGLSFVRVLSVSDKSLVDLYRETLDQGESEALALAIEVKIRCDIGRKTFVLDM